jgi:hypothetical protein
MRADYAKRPTIARARGMHWPSTWIAHPMGWCDGQDSRRRRRAQLVIAGCHALAYHKRFEPSSRVPVSAIRADAHLMSTCHAIMAGVTAGI